MSEARIVIGADSSQAISELERLKAAFTNNKAAIQANAALAKSASLISDSVTEMARLLDISKIAATNTQAALDALKLDPNALIVPDAVFKSLQSWRDKAAYAVGATYANLADAARSAWEDMKSFAEKQIIVWGVAAAIGISAAVLGAVYAAFKSISFAIGLLTGESYKSANIDALIAANIEVKKLQEILPLTATGASALNQALKTQGTTAEEYAGSISRVRGAISGNADELDRLGVKYKDQKGQLLSTRETLESAATVLETYTTGWDRNQAVQAIGMGTEKQIAAALAITAASVQIAKEKLIEYNLIIGDGTQEATNNYEVAMKAFNSEMSLTSQGFSRAIADNIMPALTNFAEFFKDGMPFVVNTFRYSIATITSLFFGLKTSVYMVTESILGSLSALGSVIGGVAGAMVKAVQGDFVGAQNSLTEGWDNAKNRIGAIGSNIVEQARANSKAMALAWGADTLKANATEDALKRVGKAWTPPPKTTTVGAEKESEYAKLNRLIQEKIDLDTQALERGRELSAAESFSVKITNDMNSAKVGLTTTERTLIEGKLELQQALAKEAAWQKQANDETKKHFETVAQVTRSLREEVKSQQDATDKTGLQAKALQDLEQAKFKNLIADKLLRASVKDVIDPTRALGDEWREQAALLLKNAGLKAQAFDKSLKAAMDLSLQGIADETAALTLTNAQREIAIKLREMEKLGLEKGAAAYEEYAQKIRAAVISKEVIDEGVKSQVGMWQTIEGAAKGTFISIFDSGKSAFTRLKDTLKNGLYALLYEMTVKRWLISVAASVSGAGVTQQAFGATGLASGASNLSTLYGAATGGTAAAIGSAFQAGAAIGTEAFSAGVAMMTNATGVSSFMAGGAQALGALGPAGWIALAAIAAFAIFSKNDKIASTSTGSLSRNYNADGSVRSSASMNIEGNAGAMLDGLHAGFKGLQTALGLKGGASFAYGAHTGNDGDKPEFRIQGNGFDSGLVKKTDEALALAAARVIFAALKSSELPRELAGLFNGLDPAGMSAEQINEVYAYGQALKVLDVTIGALNFAALKDQSYDMAQTVINMSGGLEALNNNLAAYYENFFSAEEKRANVVKHITATLNAAGGSYTTADVGSASRAQFRALAESASTSPALVAALIAVSGQFASITGEAVKLTDAITGVVTEVVDLSDTLKNLLQTRVSLEADLLQAQGRSAEADAARRLQAITGYSAAEVAAYDYNAAIRAQISTLTAASAAALQASADQAAAAAALAATHKGLTDQLSILKGTETDYSISLRDATDATTRTLLAQIHAQQGLNAATEKASADQAAATQKAYATLADATQKVDTAHSNLTAAYARESGALQTTIDKFVGFSKSLLAFRASLMGGPLSTLSPEAKYLAAKAQFERTSALAGTGNEAAIGELQGVSQQFLESSRDYNASTMAYASDFEAVQAGLRITAGAAMTQAGIAQTQLTALQASVSGLITINQSVLSVYSAIIALSNARAVQTVAAANPALPTVSAADIRAYAGSVTWDSAGDRQIYAKAREMGASSAQVDEALKLTPGTAKSKALALGLASFDVGSNYVPYDMTARLHQGEQIKPARYVDVDRSEREQTNKLLREVLIELRADKTQRAAVSDAQIKQLEILAEKTDATKRELARA